MTELRSRRSSEELRDLSLRIRRRSIEMVRSAGSSHVGGCLSSADLLAVVYGNILRIDPQNPNSPGRDRFVMSKGHAAAALYAVLAECGFVSPSELASFYQDGSSLLGHVTRGAMPGIEVSTGSLGHGLPMATGMALGAKRDHKGYRTFCLLSDGECDEGSTWEAVLLGAHQKLDNLIAIVDYNKIQSLGSVPDVIALEPFAAKWRAFGWSVVEIDGHDVAAIEAALSGAPMEEGRPSCVIAHTVKGKGVSFMEGKLLWHYRSPQGEEFERALAELGDENR